MPEGQEESGTGATPETPPANPATGKGDPEALGDAGKKALDAERQARREAEARLKELEPLAAKARELEESQKTEIEKATEARTVAEREAAEARGRALRLEIALEKAPEGMPIAKIRKLADRIQGDDREALEADAAELFEEFTTKPTPPGKAPTDGLRPGTPDPETDPEPNYDKVAEKIFSSKRI